MRVGMGKKGNVLYKSHYYYPDGKRYFYLRLKAPVHHELWGRVLIRLQFVT